MQKKVETLVNLLFTKSLNRAWHHFPKINCAAVDMSSTMGLGNEMNLKSRLPVFSLVHIQCLHMLCFWFCNLQPLS